MSLAKISNAARVVVARPRCSSMAIEYGSSPDEQPADQMRIFLTVLRARISGTISSANAASCAGSRKKYVSFVVTRS